MLYKYCKCGKRIPQSIPRCAECQASVNEANRKRYNPQQARAYRETYQETEMSHVYRSKKWRQTRDAALAESMGVDLWVWHTEGRLQPGTHVHHIFPLEDTLDRAFDLSNLIALSAQSHMRIHALYDMGDEEKARTQAILFEAKKAFEENFRKTL